MEKKRTTREIEYEIVNQILISEICFDICKSIPIIPGRGSDFLPFYYNLNFSKAIISLHSLLASTLTDELSIRNYLKQHKEDLSNRESNDFETEITSISEAFKNVLPVSLRHKVFAHIDQGFKHSDFSCAYISPDFLDGYILIVQNLKKVFFKFCNHSQTDYPFSRIIKQSELIIKTIVKNSDFRR